MKKSIKTFLLKAPGNNFYYFDGTNWIISDQPSIYSIKIVGQSITWAICPNDIKKIIPFDATVIESTINY